MVMEYHVLIPMSAKRVLTTVIGRPCALIPGVPITVHVLKAIMGMVKSAKVRLCMYLFPQRI